MAPQTCSGFHAMVTAMSGLCNTSILLHGQSIVRGFCVVRVCELLFSSVCELTNKEASARHVKYLAMGCVAVSALSFEESF